MPNTGNYLLILERSTVCAEMQRSRWRGQLWRIRRGTASYLGNREVRQGLCWFLKAQYNMRTSLSCLFFLQRHSASQSSLLSAFISSLSLALSLSNALMCLSSNRLGLPLRFITWSKFSLPLCVCVFHAFTTNKNCDISSLLHARTHLFFACSSSSTFLMCHFCLSLVPAYVVFSLLLYTPQDSVVDSGNNWKNEWRVDLSSLMSGEIIIVVYIIKPHLSLLVFFGIGTLLLSIYQAPSSPHPHVRYNFFNIFHPFSFLPYFSLTIITTFDFILSQLFFAIMIVKEVVVWTGWLFLGLHLGGRWGIKRFIKTLNV